MTVTLKTPAVLALVCDVCGTAIDYDGGPLPLGWIVVEVAGRKEVCPKDAAPLVAALGVVLEPVPVEVV